MVSFDKFEESDHRRIIFFDLSDSGANNDIRYQRYSSSGTEVWLLDGPRLRIKPRRHLICVRRRG
jgi:hypothetical protein